MRTDNQGTPTGPDRSIVQEQGNETVDVKRRVSEDVANVRQAFSQRFREALTKPVTLVIATLVFILTIGAEYLFSRIMDAVWEVDPPDKVPMISEALRKDWVRLKERAGQDIDTLPDIVLAVGEGAQLCNGLTPIDVTRVGNNWAAVNLGSDSHTMYSGARQAIGDNAWVDFIGPKNKKGLFKIHCSNS